MIESIQPYVGAALWFHPLGDDATRFVRRDAQPILAVVIYAVNDRDVTVKITDHDGHEYIRKGVVLRQPGDETIGHSHCEWPAAIGRQPTVEIKAPPPADPGPAPSEPTPDPAFESIENVAADTVDATSAPLPGDTPPEVLTALGTTKKVKR